MTADAEVKGNELYLVLTTSLFESISWYTQQGNISTGLLSILRSRRRKERREGKNECFTTVLVSLLEAIKESRYISARTGIAQLV
jgi:hypothetical protein